MVIIEKELKQDLHSPKFSCPKCQKYVNNSLRFLLNPANVYNSLSSPPASVFYLVGPALVLGNTYVIEILITS